MRVKPLAPVVLGLAGVWLVWYGLASKRDVPSPTLEVVVEAMGFELGEQPRSFRPYSTTDSWGELHIPGLLSATIHRESSVVSQVWVHEDHSRAVESSWREDPRAETPEKVSRIALAFVDRFRSEDEVWQIRYQRMVSGVKGVPDHGIAYLNPKTIRGFPVNPRVGGAVLRILPRSGKIYAATISEAKVLSFAGHVSESEARSMAEQYRFQPVSWEKTGSRGAITKLDRLLWEVGLPTEGGASAGKVKELVLCWRATYERNQAYLVIHAGTGEIVEAEGGNKYAPTVESGP